MRGWRRLLLAFTAAASFVSVAKAQSFGIELQNTMMPASGGMAGTSIAAPQDLTSALNGNPASLTQFRGTQFMFGGGWAEPTFNLTQSSNIPIVGPRPRIEPYSAKSTAPGVPLGNFGVTQELSELGLPVTVGLGFVTSSGCILDFRQVPESNGTNTAMTVFSLPISAAVDVTDRLSLGGNIAMGIAFFDGPFVGAGGMTPDYALRSTLGSNYRVTDWTTVGGYYQTEQAFTFDNAVDLDPGIDQRALDVRMDLPQNIGFGIANTAFCEGRLLLAVDVTYKLWNESALFGAVYDNQWVVQCGAQYQLGRYRLRSGYAWAENPIDDTPGRDIGGIVQAGDIPAVRYTQALLAITNQHRISAGVGVVDVLPGIDLDLMAGGMFKDSQDLGPFTHTSIESYWIALGLTWRFHRGAVGAPPVAESWASGQ